MTSYFEIGGLIVESSITSPSSPHSKVPAAERPERGRTSARGQVSSIPQTSSVSSSKASADDEYKDMAGIFGGGMIRAGIAILWVPDPLPFVDEVIGAALIGAGTGLIMYSES